MGDLETLRGHLTEKGKLTEKPEFQNLVWGGPVFPLLISSRVRRMLWPLSWVSGKLWKVQDVPRRWPADPLSGRG